MRLPLGSWRPGRDLDRAECRQPEGGSSCSCLAVEPGKAAGPGGCTLQSQKGGSSRTDFSGRQGGTRAGLSQGLWGMQMLPSLAPSCSRGSLNHRKNGTHLGTCVQFIGGRKTCVQHCWVLARSRLQCCCCLPSGLLLWASDGWAEAPVVVGRCVGLPALEGRERQPRNLLGTKPLVLCGFKKLYNLCIYRLWQVRESMWAGC